VRQKNLETHALLLKTEAAESANRAKSVFTGPDHHATVCGTDGRGDSSRKCVGQRIDIPDRDARGSSGCLHGTSIQNERNALRTAGPGPARISDLIVEDQMENWMLLRELLEQSGFHVRLAGNGVNGVEGIEAFQSWQPHFILMGWRMPVMDGSALACHAERLEYTSIVQALKIVNKQS